MRVALYPGSFDPITNGHLSIIQRGRLIFDHIFVAVADKTPKAALFSQQERVEMIREATAHMKGVEVLPFSGLTVEFAAKTGCSTILRGLRALSDFEYEFQLSLMNRRLNDSVETLFFITDYRWLFLSSTMVKGAISHGASISGLVPEYTLARLQEKYTQGSLAQGTPCLAPPPEGFARSHSSTEKTEPEASLLHYAPRKRAKRIAIYPGTFDPITNGHISIIRRALSSFDSIVVAVAENAGKHPLFSLEQRVQFIQAALHDLGSSVTVEPYRNLTVDFAEEHGACAMIRGLRATGDFEYEFQLALMNRRLKKNIQTVFIMTDSDWLFVSSSIVKAAASHGGRVEGLVPNVVLNALQELYSSGKIRKSTPCLGAPTGGYGKNT